MVCYLIDDSTIILKQHSRGLCGIRGKFLCSQQTMHNSSEVNNLDTLSVYMMATDKKRDSVPYFESKTTAYEFGHGPWAH
jgi:hypothetical protein